jgi:ADP-ribose pyrophosphatase YjhB (NUDIX family)
MRVVSYYICPRWGSVIITKDEKMLFLRRKNAHGEGSWSPPGDIWSLGNRLRNAHSVK